MKGGIKEGSMSSEGHSRGSGRSESNNPATASSSSVSNATPADNAVGAQSEFVVEKFTGKRFENGKVLMQVKWKGFPSEMSTWEPFENLTNCVLLLGEFEAELYRKQEMAFRSPASPASSCGKKKFGRPPSSTKASPANQSMPILEECQLENGKPMTSPKSNGINRAISSTPGTTAGQKIGGRKSNGTICTRVSTPKQNAIFKFGTPKSNGTSSPRVSTPKLTAGHKIGGPKSNGTKSPRVSTKASPANQSMPILEECQLENGKPMTTPKSNGINRAIASTQRTEVQKIGGRKSNGTISPKVSTPKSTASHKIGENQREKFATPSLPVPKNPVKLHPEMDLQLSDSSDDERPSCSFGGRASSSPAPALPPSRDSLEADLELSDSSTSPPNISPESSMSFGSDSLPLSVVAALSANKRSPSLHSLKERARKWQADKNVSKFGTLVKTPKKPSTPVKDVVNNMGAASDSAAPVEKAMKSIHSMQLAEKDPVVQPSVVEKKSKKIEKKSSKKGRTKKVPEKVQQKEIGDEDVDRPSTPQPPRTPAGAGRRSSFNWKMPPCKTPFGLARGLELDKVVHNFQVRDRLFLFVSWKGLDVVDAVPLEDLKEAYPAKVIEYFENMQRRYK